MKLFTYNGETPAEALRVAQQKHGEEALVVSTKEIRKRSLTQPALYEIVIAVDEEKVQLKKEEESLSQKSNKVAERLEEIAQKERERRKTLLQAPKGSLMTSPSSSLMRCVKSPRSPMSPPRNLQKKSLRGSCMKPLLLRPLPPVVLLRILA